MKIYEVLLGATPDGDSLRLAAASIFEEPVARVHVVHGLDELESRVPVLLQISESKGQFPTHISIFCQRDTGVSELDVARLLCAHLDTTALVPDDSPDPYQMIWIKAGEEPRIVWMDVDALDGVGEYRIVGPAGESAGQEQD